MSLLEKINKPSDIKKISREELPELSSEIRDRIIDVVSKNGGHLGSSLGVVDLTIALFYVFDLENDKIVWDVGHQSYAHKILSGRNDKFDTLRTKGGLSGFPKISESKYDAFTTGHSSTSVSAGSGISCGKRIKNEKSKVISVIGDGSLTGGIAYEGLNYVGDSGLDHITILNDNDMSISQNVGAISSFLSRKLSANYLQTLKSQFGEFLKSIPGIGEDIYHFAKRSEDSFKTFVTPGMLFEAFNIDYFGPIDGHNLDHLIDILNNIKELNEPVLLHITTVKGKGYIHAEKNPVNFHGIGPFDIKSGKPIKNGEKKESYTSVFGKAIVDIAKKDEKVVAITAAMPEGTGLLPFAEEFPDRFFDVGIAEQHAVTFAAGLATEGIKPVVAIYSTFLQRAYDQILHDVAIESLPVVFAIDRGGIVGEDGPTHHGLFDFSYLRNIPGLTIMTPKDADELKDMLEFSISHNGPVALRYPRGEVAHIKSENPSKIIMGKGEIVRQGSDILLIAAGRTVSECVLACDILKEKGVNATLFNTRFIKPLDIEKIAELVNNTTNIITVEEQVIAGGLGSAVLEGLNDKKINGFNLERIGIKDTFVKHGAANELRKEYGIDAEAIVAKALEMTS